MDIIALNWMLDQLGTDKLRLVRLLDDLGIEILSHSGQTQDQVAVWAPASDGQKALAAAIRFEIPAGTTVKSICFLDSAEYLTWATKTIPAEERKTYANNGLFDVTGVIMNLAIV
jgi:hypothetical protein